MKKSKSHSSIRSNCSRHRFAENILAIIHKEKILGIHAGKDSAHRIIGFWAVVMEGRVFVRSWSLKPRSWWRTFLEDPQGIIPVGEKEIPIRAVQTRGARFKDLVRTAYRRSTTRRGQLSLWKICHVNRRGIRGRSWCQSRNEPQVLSL